MKIQSLKPRNRRCGVVTSQISMVRILLLVSFLVCTTILVLYSIVECPNEEVKLFTQRLLDGNKWTYICTDRVCRKKNYINGDRVSLDTCNMLCGEPQLWPMPLKINYNDKNVSKFTQQQLHLETIAEHPAMLELAFDIFKKNVAYLVANIETKQKSSDVGNFKVRIIVDNSDVTKLSVDTDESYILSVDLNDNDMIADIHARSYFGGRHALETLSQLIWWDDYENSLKIFNSIEVEDRPAFKYRGLMVDTARNYFKVDILKKVIDGMAANKLNTFHWHITDAQSFPLCLPNAIELCEYGAYSSNSVYSTRDVQELIKYAEIRGIRILIEIDAPSHMLSGWKWDADWDDLVLSADGLDGQLNPDKPEAMDVLKIVYSDVLNLMGNDELFHIGGDEVNMNLWKQSATTSGYTDSKLFWASYVQQMLEALKSANDGKSPKNIIIWSSPLTDDSRIGSYLNNDSVIIQHWLGGIRAAVKEGFRVLYSDVGDWYLDCGFGAWREGRNANCDPYRTWQIVYRLRPWKDIDMKQVVGGEVCLWTEQVGEFSLETRIWPRAAAFAERIWTNPDTGLTIRRDVYTRLDTQRRRMVGRGLQSEVFWPQFCTQNPGIC